MKKRAAFGLLFLHLTEALFANTSIASGNCFAEASCYAGNHPSPYYDNTFPQSSTQGCLTTGQLFFRGDIYSYVCSNGHTGVDGYTMPYGNIQVISPYTQNTIAAYVTVDITFADIDVTGNGYGGDFDYILASALYGIYNNYPAPASALVFGLQSAQPTPATDYHATYLSSGYTRYYNTFVIPGNAFYQAFYSDTDNVFEWYNISWIWKLSCVACPAGKYYPLSCTPTLASCLPCPANTYNQLTGQTACLACTGGSISNPGQLSCNAPCGSYWQNGAVITCPPDSFCPD